MSATLICLYVAVAIVLALTGLKVSVTIGDAALSFHTNRAPDEVRFWVWVALIVDLFVGLFCLSAKFA